MNEHRGPVLIAVKNDRDSMVAFRHGIDLALRESIPAHVVHVIPDTRFLPMTGLSLIGDSPFVAEEQIAAAKSRLEYLITDTYPDVRLPVTLHVVQGSADAGILQIADEVDASMIVIGAGTKKTRPKIFSGIAERVVRHATCPVLIARKRKQGCVLAATDFSDLSLPAVHRASVAASYRSNQLIIIHVVETSPFLFFAPDPMVSPFTTSDMHSTFLHESKEKLRIVAEEFSAKSILKEGNPIDAILHAVIASRAELLVIGSHGKSGLKRLTLGSVSEGLIRRAKCSLLVVRVNSDSHQ